MSRGRPSANAVDRFDDGRFSVVITYRPARLSYRIVSGFRGGSPTESTATDEGSARAVAEANEYYTNETMAFTTVEAFLGYCSQALGEVPELTHEAGNSRWIDEDGEVALVEIEDAALVAAFESDGAEQGANDFVTRKGDVGSGDPNSWLTGDKDHDGLEDDLDSILAGMDEPARIKAAEGSEDAFLSSAGRPQIDALKTLGISAPAIWDTEIDGATLGERWSKSFIAAWAKAAERD